MYQIYVFLCPLSGDPSTTEASEIPTTEQVHTMTTEGSGDPSTTEASEIRTTEQAYTMSAKPSDTASPTKSTNEESTQLITVPAAPTKAVDTATTESGQQASSGDFLISYRSPKCCHHFCHGKKTEQLQLLLYLFFISFIFRQSRGRNKDRMRH